MDDEGEINDLLEVTNVKGRVTKKNANMHVVILGDLDLKKSMKWSVRSTWHLHKRSKTVIKHETVKQDSQKEPKKKKKKKIFEARRNHPGWLTTLS